MAQDPGVSNTRGYSTQSTPHADVSTGNTIFEHYDHMTNGNGFICSHHDVANLNMMLHL